jgi:hypothetical protein
VRVLVMSGIVWCLAQLEFGEAAYAWLTRDIGHPVEVNVVQDDQAVIARGDEVLLEIVRPHREGQRLGLDRMLRQVARRAPVSDDDRSHKLLEVTLITK